MRKAHHKREKLRKKTLGLNRGEEGRAAHCRLQWLLEWGWGQRREEERPGRIKHLTIICPRNNAGIKPITVSEILTDL